jgi:hypothetical protein
MNDDEFVQQIAGALAPSMRAEMDQLRAEMAQLALQVARQQPPQVSVAAPEVSVKVPESAPADVVVTVDLESVALKLTEIAVLLRQPVTKTFDRDKNGFINSVRETRG